MSAMTECFRKEAGQHQSLKILSRVHQFKKVECVLLCEPSKSQEEFENLLSHCASLVRNLGLTYRIIRLSGDDTSFASSITYDIECWLPVSKKWVEVSSCSNCTNYQTREAKIKTIDGGESVFAHSLNSSGLALPRILISLLETYADSEGIFDTKKIISKLHI